MFDDTQQVVTFKLPFDTIIEFVTGHLEAIKHLNTGYSYSIEWSDDRSVFFYKVLKNAVDIGTIQVSRQDDGCSIGLGKMLNDEVGILFVGILREVQVADIVSADKTIDKFALAQIYKNLSKFTKDQQALIRLSAEGKTQAEIAEELSYADANSVKTTLARLRKAHPKAYRFVMAIFKPNNNT